MMTVGLICTYARPFTNNEPVGKLGEDVVPPELKHVHDHLITMRDQLFAHADALLAAAPDEYPNEAVIVNDGQTLSMNCFQIRRRTDILRKDRAAGQRLDREDELLQAEIREEILERPGETGQRRVPVKRGRSSGSLVHQTVRCRKANSQQEKEAS